MRLIAILQKTLHFISIIQEKNLQCHDFIISEVLRHFHNDWSLNISCNFDKSTENSRRIHRETSYCGTLSTKIINLRQTAFIRLKMALKRTKEVRNALRNLWTKSMTKMKLFCSHSVSRKLYLEIENVI